MAVNIAMRDGKGNIMSQFGKLNNRLSDVPFFSHSLFGGNVVGR